MTVVISGYILSSKSSKENAILENNKIALASLPKRAYVIRDMFSMVPLSYRGHTDTFQVIHFAASYDEMYCLDKHWVVEFEALLRKLSWHLVKVYHSYSGVSLQYLAKDHEYDHEVIPTQDWGVKAFESHHNLKEIDFDDVVG